MKLNQLKSVSIPQCLAFVLLVVTSMFFAPSALAQNPTPTPDPGLKLLRVKVEVNKSTKLDIESIPSNTYVPSTEAFAYRPELRNAPKTGDQYEQYVRRPSRNLYTVLSVTNEGTKAVKSIEWEYTSPHFDGDKIVIYKKTTSHMKIGSGETVALRKKLSDEYNCGLHLGSMMGEQALNATCRGKARKSTGMHLVEAKLLKITYEDGTVWKKP